MTLYDVLAVSDVRRANVRACLASSCEINGALKVLRNAKVYI